MKNVTLIRLKGRGKASTVLGFFLNMQTHNNSNVYANKNINHNQTTKNYHQITQLEIKSYEAISGTIRENVKTRLGDCRKVEMKNAHEK